MSFIQKITFAAFNVLLLSAHSSERIWHDPELLSFPQEGVILTIGDSQTVCQSQDPAITQMRSDSTLWDGQTLPFWFPDSLGQRRTNIDLWAPTSTSSPRNPSPDQLEKARFYSYGATWTHRLADLLGTSQWVSVASSGATICDTPREGGFANGLESYAFDNPYLDRADLIVIHIGINDLGYPDRSAQLVIDKHKRVIEGIFQRAKPEAKLLVLGVQPFGGHSTAEGVKLARADTLDRWIGSRFPFSDDSTGIWSSALACFSEYAGRFSTFAYAEWLRSYSPESGDLELVPTSDTLDVRFNADFLHKSQRGDNYLGNLIAWKVFDCALDVEQLSDTLDAGDWLEPLFLRSPRTYFVDQSLGDNFLNWLDCEDASRPLSTVQAALYRASSGDHIVFEPGVYTDYWDKAPLDGQSPVSYIRPWVFQEHEDAAITLNGNGSVLKRPAGLNTLFSLNPATRPDSFAVTNLVLRDWTFSGWDSVSTNYSQSAFMLRNCTGLVFDYCRFETGSRWFEIDQEWGVVKHANRLRLLNSTFDSWDHHEDASSYAIYVTCPAANWMLELRNCTIRDTTGWKTKFLYDNSVQTGSLESFGDVRILECTFEVDSMSNSLLHVGNADLKVVNNSFSFGSTSYQGYELIRGSTSVMSGDTLLYCNNTVNAMNPSIYSESCNWSPDAEYYESCTQSDGFTTCATSWNQSDMHVWNGNVLEGDVNNTIRFGGSLLIGPEDWNQYRLLEDLAIQHALGYASMGHIQHMLPQTMLQIEICDENVLLQWNTSPVEGNYTVHRRMAGSDEGVPLAIVAGSSWMDPDIIQADEHRYYWLTFEPSEASQ